MPIDLRTIDLTHVEDVTDIEPTPQAAVSDTEHHFGAIGGDARGYLLELLEETSEKQPFGLRVFDRLGLEYTHTTWRDYDLFWVDGGDDAFAEALATWHASYEMEGSAA